MNDLIIKVISSIIIQIIFIFAFYVLFHGEVAPGGAFQAGALFAVAFIFYIMVHGLKVFQQRIKPKILDYAMSIGVLIYAGNGLLGLLLGRNFLNYYYLAKDPHFAQKIGILVIEIGVAITVAAVLTNIFIKLASFKSTTDDR
ncbi:Na(+)/H(+) antiporter subunit B [Rickettsiales endosymbiont of Stachyamoeba lipophora]|uniref:Na(+)/H(+) antiporter subunit B n=1 Tax=Rickettsiales endosymbiont of Stachyamoeba lipophora TaxID=2486578 RepID=UPI000F64C1C4|nr:Na(+)/H(+) antiporter subunit B [Rickettsiales endosymbiont of Stachyamoeba lipophora]AZL15790.1 Na(+)/H(+) antiporter subunit B [Rickettsiales endosymbiont of Stachyamoeba lipophora]